ncbi:MAG TPA: siderophore-interacting protein [Acidimicrobiales bacterium]|nr:siderophore-interacting protein [Acidimicrobiales bacterium]
MSRRPPPPFLEGEVVQREWLTPRLVRVTLQGSELGRLEVTQPASSLRVLLPDPSRPDDLELPGWDGNRFLLSDGSRPVLRTLTPRHVDRGAGRLQVDVVVHGQGAASRWAAAAGVGSPAAVSGPARGYVVDPAATELIVGGDETAIAAVSQIVESAPDGLALTVLLETPGEESRPVLPDRPGCELSWVDQRGDVPGAALVGRMSALAISPAGRLWAAGEAAAMQRLRSRLFTELGVPRTQATIRGYWKHGRTAADDGDGPAAS